LAVNLIAGASERSKMTPTDAIAALNDLREIVRAGAMSGEADAVGICNGLIKHFQAELAHDPVCPACGGTGVIREYIERPVNGQVELLCPCLRKKADKERCCE